VLLAEAVNLKGAAGAFRGAGITVFSITVPGAVGGNGDGTFGLAEVSEFAFTSAGALNPNLDLMAQRDFQHVPRG
jgi:hypothetical protein